MQGYRDALESLGHTVTSRWINGGHQIDDNGLSAEAKEEERTRLAIEDMQDLWDAECCISFTEAPRSTNTRGGRHVEFGCAFSWGKRLIVVGHRENVFHCLPRVQFFPDWSGCLAALSAEQTSAQRGENG